MQRRAGAEHHGQPTARTSASPSTPRPRQDAGDVVWATYRETQTLDPIQGFDYPEKTVDSILCESLLRQASRHVLRQRARQADPALGHELDFTINADAKFWDGSPVTAADAVFSLKRAADPKGGGFYSAVFDRVKSIEATGDKTLKITLTQPDYWLIGELSSTPGEIVEKKYVEAKGKDFGTGRRRHDVLRPLQARLLADRQGRQGGPQPRLLGHHAAQAQAHEPDAHRRPR